MNPRIPILLILFLVPVAYAVESKRSGFREPLSQNSPPEAVERAIADSLQDLLDDAETFFQNTGPRSVRAILTAPGGDGNVTKGTGVMSRSITSGTVSRSKLAAATVKLQEQASATLSDLSTVMRGVQERLARKPRPRPDTNEHYERMREEARRLSSAVSAYSSHFKQATRGDIGQWIAYELPSLPDPRDKSGKMALPTKAGTKNPAISGFLVY